MCIVSSKGEVKRVIKDLSEIKMGFMTDLNRLSNGSTVICFYQGSHNVIGVTPEKKAGVEMATAVTKNCCQRSNS
ncbi:MAG: hypothetical protein CMI26_12400 [Opitutae bacterium]|nr:hypothetical protein [Opitutae bacterium]